MSQLTEQQLLRLQQQCQQASPSPYTAFSQCSSHNGPRSISGVSYSKVSSRPRSSSCSGRSTYPLPPLAYPLHPDSQAGLSANIGVGPIGATNGPCHAPFAPENTTAYRDLSTRGCAVSASGPAHLTACRLGRVASEAGLGHTFRCQQFEQQQQSARPFNRRTTDTDVLAGELDFLAPQQ